MRLPSEDETKTEAPEILNINSSTDRCKLMKPLVQYR